MRKFVGGAMVLALAFGLVACAQETDVAEEPMAPEDTATIETLPAETEAAEPGETTEAAAPAEGEATLAEVKCPIMGSSVSTEFSAVHEGKEYYFCCAGCPEQFKENPEEIIANNPEWAETARPVEG